MRVIATPAYSTIVVRRVVSGALSVVLAAALVGCDSSPGPDETAQEFLLALASDDAKAAGLTDSPDAAKAALEQARGALEPEKVTAKLGEVSEDGEQATANYTLTWTLPHGREWKYQTQAELQSHGDGWQVRWSPSVLHPELAAEQTLALEVDEPEVAPVLGRDGGTLLASSSVVSIMLYPAEAGDANGGVPKVARSLSAALRKFDKTITAKSIRSGAKKAGDGADDNHVVAVLREEDYLSVKDTIYDLPGVKFSRQQRMLGPRRGYAATVLPAIRTLVEERLAGEAGWRVLANDASGAEVAELHRQDPQPSEAVRSTLSLEVQDAAEGAVDPVGKPAMLVAIQPSSGDILAVAQNDRADKQGAIALSGRYPPGSTFKIATALAALTSGSVASDSKVNCPATTVIGGRLIPNEDRFELGKVPLTKAFARSCNTTFARLAARMPADALTKAAADLGIGADFVIPGSTTITGSAPPADDQVQRAENGFGQGKILASPFGMALVAATVKSGQTPTPSLMEGEKTEATGLGEPLPADAAKALRKMMRQVVTDGTARKLSGLGDVRGKTGTAQFGDGKHSHGWFAGYRGDLAFASLVVSGESSGPAVDIAHRFLSAL